jgi:hypothetical protein
MNYFIELAFFILSIFILFVLAVDNVRQRVKVSRLNKETNQSIADYIALSQKLEEAIKNTDEKKIEQTEGFLKFVSESRDWAFQYIERVQIAIKNFQNIFHPIALDYYKDKDKPISQEEFGNLFEAYKKLIEELPDEGKKK